MFLLLRKTCQQKLDRYHRFFVPFLSRGEGMVVYGRRAHFKEASANANRFNRRSRRERERKGEEKKGKKEGGVQVRGYSKEEEEEEEEKVK